MLGSIAKLNWGMGHIPQNHMRRSFSPSNDLWSSSLGEETIKKQRLLRKIQSSQRLINIKIAKAYRTISYEASCLLAGVQPIGIEIEGKTCLYKRNDSAGKEDYEWDKPLPATEWPHHALRADIMETTDLITYPTEMFTDGSKIGDKVGAGVAIFSEKSLMRKCKYRLQNHCSNNQAEQIAILKALEQLLSLPDQNKGKVAIYTDSKVTLDSLNNNTIHSVLIEEIRNIVRNLTQQNWTIHFGWVKAHAGIEGNEIADTLAKDVAQDEKDGTYI